MQEWFSDIIKWCHFHLLLHLGRKNLCTCAVGSCQLDCTSASVPDLLPIPCHAWTIMYLLYPNCEACNIYITAELQKQNIITNLLKTSFYLSVIKSYFNMDTKWEMWIVNIFSLVVSVQPRIMPQWVDNKALTAKRSRPWTIFNMPLSPGIRMRLPWTTPLVKI